MSEKPAPAPTPPSARRKAQKAPSVAQDAGLLAPPATPPPAAEDAPTAIPKALKSQAETADWKLRLVKGEKLEGKSEQEIRQWVDRKAVEMLPAVIADLHFDLKFGTDKQRAEARDRIMDMHGLRKREAAAGNHPTIILNLGGDQKNLTQKLPWLSRSDVASEGEGEGEK